MAGGLAAVASRPINLPPAEIALPGKSITQFTVLPVAFAAVPARYENDENTLWAKPCCSGGGSLDVFTSTDGNGVGAGPTAVPGGTEAVAGGAATMGDAGVAAAGGGTAAITTAGA